MSEFLLPDYIQKIISALNDSGHEAYIVGGCVRDILRGVEPHDYDMTTSALPDQTAAVFADYNVIKTGIKHGTVTVMYPDDNGVRQPIEITTYRIDGSYADNRHPEAVQFTRSLQEDLSRRDFTINAMAYDGRNAIVDIFGGRKDISARMIRCVGEPSVRFHEDGLRILRALRFASTLDFDLDDATSDAIVDCRCLLPGISAERILVELKKLLLGHGAIRIFKKYRSVLEVILPELSMLSEADYLKMSEAIENAHDDTVTKFSIMFALCGNNAAETAMRRLKADNRMIKDVTALCRAFANSAPTTESAIKRICSVLGYENAHRLCDMRLSYGVSDAARIDDIINMYETRGECISLRQLNIDGSILGTIGITGKTIGRVLNCLLDLVIDGEIENDSDVLTEYAKKIIPKLP